MPSVSSAYQQSVLNFLTSLGVNHQQIPASLCPTLADSSRVSMEDYITLLNKGANLTGDSLFGFALGKHIQAKDYGVLGYLVESCENLEQAIHALTRFDALVADIGITTVLNGPDNTRIVWSPKCDDCKQMVLRNTTAWVATVYKILGPACKLNAVTFTFLLTQSEQSSLQEWFGCKVTGSAETNAIVFPQHLLHIPFTSENKAMFNALLKVTETELKEQVGQESFQLKSKQYEDIKYQVSALLKANPTLKNCNQQRVADALFISSRTLQRKLKRSGTSFQQIVNNERKARVDKILAHHTIADTADLLGFQEQSSFTHAFKRWFSTTPLKYKKRLTDKK